MCVSELFQFVMTRNAPGVQDTAELGAKRSCAGLPMKLMIALVESRTWPPQAFVNPVPRLPPRLRRPGLVKATKATDGPQSNIEPRRYRPSVNRSPPTLRIAQLPRGHPEPGFGRLL